ncbi:MAG: S8 family peptidase [Candidatus Sabulitectum sp.]|nr:S8 family peptidase [Candidatus Sabulitectum sp.]
MRQIVSLLVLAITVLAGSIDPNLAVIMASNTDTDLIPVFILAQGQVNQNWVYVSTLGMHREERQQFAVSAMKEIADVGQSDIINYLNTFNSISVGNIQSLWLANAVYCEVTRSVIRSIALRSDVVLVESACDPDGGLIEPVEVRTPNPEERGKGLAWGVAKINADDVWSMGYEGQGIIVAVIDTGVDYEHLDLCDNMWSDTPAGYEYGWDFFNNDSDPMDDYGHGTHCAGSIAGDGSGGTQTGVAPSAQIMALRVNYYGGGEYTWIQAMEFGAEHGAAVLSMSLGTDHGNTTLRTAEENLLTAGVYHSVAASNDGPGAGTIGSSGDSPPPWFHPDQSYHGGQSAVVTVGATDNNDVIASFSSRGPVTWWNDYNDTYPLIDPDISGPGVDIVSTKWTGDSGSGFYTTMSGTSMATPHLAGVAALLLSVNPNLTVSQLDNIIETTSVDLGVSGKDNSYGAGRVDAYQAMSLALTQTGIDNGSSGTNTFTISAISPNPSNGFASFSIYTSVSGLADVSVFDVSGRRVANINSSDIETGANAFNWQIPAEMGSGVYFVRASIHGNVVSSRMTVLR